MLVHQTVVCFFSKILLLLYFRQNYTSVARENNFQCVLHLFIQETCLYSKIWQWICHLTTVTIITIITNAYLVDYVQSASTFIFNEDICGRHISPEILLIPCVRTSPNPSWGSFQLHVSRNHCVGTEWFARLGERQGLRVALDRYNTATIVFRVSRFVGGRQGALARTHTKM